MSAMERSLPSAARAERTMLVAIALAVLDSSYLSWRYLALRLGLVRPGTSICSWTSFIDCDRVLLTPEANAFFVPNALLGSAFTIGCLIWWFGGRRLGAGYRFHLVSALTFWLGVAALFTLRFFWLLFHLPFFCPFCPLNHLMIYVAFGSALVLFRQTRRPAQPVRWLPLILLVITCVSFFLIVQVIWFFGRPYFSL
jgi:uncharacterized membrane protein